MTFSLRSRIYICVKQKEHQAPATKKTVPSHLCGTKSGVMAEQSSRLPVSARQNARVTTHTKFTSSLVGRMMSPFMEIYVERDIGIVMIGFGCFKIIFKVFF